MPDFTTQTTMPSGSRRLSLAMLLVADQAAHFQGAPKGSGKPFRYLAAFQEAEPYLGLPPQAYKLIAWLIKQTQAQDWEEGSRPICWPSAARQAEFLGLSPARVKILNRALFEAGIFILRDSPTGKRYGRRDPDGRIIEAYGFDLSPLAYRFDEFIRLAAEAKAEREQLRGLRQRATIARRAIRQIGEALTISRTPCRRNGRSSPPTPPRWSRDTPDQASRRPRPDRAKPRTPENAGGGMAEGASQAVETSPVGLADEPHNISTNLSDNLSDTVIASKGK